MVELTPWKLSNNSFSKIMSHELPEDHAGQGEHGVRLGHRLLKNLCTDQTLVRQWVAFGILAWGVESYKPISNNVKPSYISLKTRQTTLTL